LEKPEVNF